MKKILSILTSAAIVALLFTACKPTEANYREAYDAALVKRNEAAAEQMRPATGLLSDDGPQLRMVNGDSIYVLRATLRDADGKVLPGKWAVAVGKFKMDTNAKASAEDLKHAGFQGAMMAKSLNAQYFTVADTAMTFDSAHEKANSFKAAFPEYPFVGLPGAPVLISL